MVKVVVTDKIEEQSMIKQILETQCSDVENSVYEVKNQKTAVVSIIGKPNVGKSTLLNRVIGQRISIVTPKAQTTRNIINGITTIRDTQIIFLDTPGIFDAKREVDKSIVRQAWSSIHSADFVILLLDANHKIREDTTKIIQRVLKQGLNLIVAINKVDIETHLMSILQYFIHNPELAKIPIFQISALTGQGVDLMLEHIIIKAPIGLWHHSIDDITTLPMKFLAAEITREQLFLNLKHELPYNLTVLNEKWENFDNGSVKIHQVINVTTDAHKKIILGKHGSMIRSIGSSSRKQFEEIYGIKAHLFLFVRVRENLLDSPDAFEKIEQCGW